jgi:hypothetical protein
MALLSACQIISTLLFAIFVVPAFGVVSPLQAAGGLRRRRPSQHDARQLAEFCDELVLELRVRDFPGRLLLLEMMPVAAADQSFGFVTGREPCLRPLSHIEIDGRIGA